MTAEPSGTHRSSVSGAWPQRWSPSSRPDADTGRFTLDCRSGRMHWDDPLRRLWHAAAAQDELDVAQVLEAVAPADRASLRRAWRRSLLGFRVSLTVCARTPGGRRWLQLAWRVYREAGAPVARGRVRDATPQLNQHITARGADALCEPADVPAAPRTALLAALGHELGLPVRTILLAAQQMQSLHGEGQGEQSRWLQLLLEAGVHLQDLTQALGQDRTHSNDAPAALGRGVSLGDTFRQAMAWLQGQAEDAGVELRADASLDAAWVKAAATPLRQVLLNLVSNAIKYGRRGGHVHCRASVTGANVELVVADDGLGMSPAQLQRLARPFDRLGREDSGIEGSGLGAYIVERLVRDMGGSIRYASTPGQGTRVTLQLPGSLARAEAAAALQPLAALEGAVAASPDELRLLVVDDEPLTPMLMQLQFEALGGVAARFVSQASEAVPAWQAALAAGDAPQVLLLDLNIGATRGETVLRALREAGCAVPAVAYTADASAEDDAALRAAGFADAWTKPLDMRELGRRLAALQNGGVLDAPAQADAGCPWQRLHRPAMQVADAAAGGRYRDDGGSDDRLFVTAGFRPRAAGAWPPGARAGGLHA